MLYNPNSGYGLAESIRLHLNLPVMGKLLVVAPSTDPNYDRLTNLVKTDPEGRVRLYTTVAAAYAEATTNANDVIALSAYSSHSEAMLTVAKNRIHFIGLDSGGRINSQGSKLSTPATSVAGSIAVISNSGTRNTYRNIKFIQQGTNTAQTSAFIDTGEGTYMQDCCIHHNSILSTAATQALLFKGDTCHYKHVEIGNSTVYHAVANQAPLVLKTPGRYSYFENCSIIQYSSETTASCVDAPDANSVIGWIQFRGCTFMMANKGDGATAGGTMAEAITSICTSGYIQVDNRCSFFNVALSSEADASILNAAGVAVAAADGGKAIAGA